MHRPERGDVLEPHLRGAVLADRHPGMRTAEDHARPADRGHADEVVCPRQERRERRCEGRPAAHLQPDRRRDELLLGDVHLEEPVRVRLPEDVRERRVGHLAVEGDDVSACRSDRGERIAVRLAGRDLAAELVARELERARRELVRLTGRRLPNLDPEVALAAELRDRFRRVVERLPVEAVDVLDRRDALALDRARDEHRRLAGRRDRFRVRAVDLLDRVPVHRDRVPAECLRALDVRVQIPADHRLAALAEAVHVEDRGQVVEVVVRGVLERLPHRALGELAVTAEHPHAERKAVEVLPRQGDADADR